MPDPIIEQIKELDQGTGLVCPHEDCQGKFIVNIEHEPEALAFVYGFCCPYCARHINLPEDWR